MAELILLLTQQLLKVTNMCSHTCAKTPTSTPLVSCIVKDVVRPSLCGPSHAKCAAKRCYHFLCFLTVWTPFVNRENNKDGKFKVCSCFFSSDDCRNLTGLCDIFCLHFLPDLRQIWTFKFPKVVRQHKGVAGNNIGCVLLEISFSFQWWKNFENRFEI